METLGQIFPPVLDMVIPIVSAFIIILFENCQTTILANQFNCYWFIWFQIEDIANGFIWPGERKFGAREVEYNVMNYFRYDNIARVLDYSYYSGNFYSGFRCNSNSNVNNIFRF